MAGDPRPRYEWNVAKVKEDALEATLNRLEREWEVFSITPTISFGGKFMGAPVPSDVLYTVISRRHRASSDNGHPAH